MGAVLSQCRMIFSAMRMHCKGPSRLRSEVSWIGQHLWIQKAGTTLRREGVLFFQHTDFADHVVVSRTFQGDKSRKILVPQWQRVVLAFHRKQISSPAVKRYLQSDNHPVPEKPVCTCMLWGLFPGHTLYAQHGVAMHLFPSAHPDVQTKFLSRDQG